jgi:hypothetical protein
MISSSGIDAAAAVLCISSGVTATGRTEPAERTAAWSAHVLSGATRCASGGTRSPRELVDGRTILTRRPAAVRGCWFQYAHTVLRKVGKAVCTSDATRERGRRPWRRKSRPRAGDALWTPAATTHQRVGSSSPTSRRRRRAHSSADGRLRLQSAQRFRQRTHEQQPCNSAQSRLLIAANLSETARAARRACPLRAAARS